MSSERCSKFGISVTSGDTASTRAHSRGGHEPSNRNEYLLLLSPPTGMDFLTRQHTLEAARQSRAAHRQRIAHAEASLVGFKHPTETPNAF